MLPVSREGINLSELITVSFHFQKSSFDSFTCCHSLFPLFFWYSDLGKTKTVLILPHARETQEQILNESEKLGVNSENSEQRFHHPLKPNVILSGRRTSSLLSYLWYSVSISQHFFSVFFSSIHSLILQLYSNFTNLHVIAIAGKANKRLALFTL